MSNVNRPVTPSAAAHAERIRAGEEERQAAAKERDSRQTYEIYGERAAAAARADEELREQARRNDARARGEWVPGEEANGEDIEEAYDDEEYEEDADVDEEEAPVSTAERYARQERAKIKAEHEANLRARASQARAMGRPLAPQYPAMVRQVHRYADLPPQSAS